MKRLEEIEGRLSAATPGTWADLPPEGDSGFLIYSRDGGGPLAATTRPKDAIFIAAAPADLRYLLDFAKAAVPALKRQKRTCKVCDEKQVCGPCDAADQALALLGGGSK